VAYYLPDLDLNCSSSQLQTIDNWLSSQAKPRCLESQLDTSVCGVKKKKKRKRKRKRKKKKGRGGREGPNLANSIQRAITQASNW